MRVCIIGPSFRFASGISSYTMRLANALSDSHQVSVMLFRELLPRFLFPGADRVSTPISDLGPAPGVRMFDGLDWYWAPSAWKAMRFLHQEKPDILIIPWWTCAVAHSEVLLMLLNAVRPRAKVVLEFHEALDMMEAQMRAYPVYGAMTRRLLIRGSHAYVAHSRIERDEMVRAFGLDAARTWVVPHGTYDQYISRDTSTALSSAGLGQQNGARRIPELVMSGIDPLPHSNERELKGLGGADVFAAETGELDEVVYLFFGLVRPYKGVDKLVKAFDGLPSNVALRSRLVIAGEVWEKHDEPRRLAEASPYRERIQMIDRYLRDDEVAAAFAGADVAVFPYLRASQSGSVHVAMANGMPVVASAIGGLGEACEEYKGALLVPPGDIDALTGALLDARALVGQRFLDPFPWSRTVQAYDAVFESLMSRRAKVPV